VPTKRPSAYVSQLLRETVSLAGRRITMAQEQGKYPGSRPYYTVASFRNSDRPSAIRHTPFLERAETLFELMAKGVTDPMGLR
jgi:hypothetical protein